MSAFQESVCHFFAVGRPKDYQKAIDALQPFDFGLDSVQFEDNNSNLFAIQDENYYWDFPEFNSPNPTNRYKTAIRRYAKFLMKENQFLSSFVFICQNEADSLHKLKRYAFHASSDHCIKAHIIIALFYSWSGPSNEREMKLHLQIAADAGHSLAQSICRRVFGGQATMLKRVKLVREKHDDTERKRKNRVHGKQPGKEKKKSRTKRSE